MSYHAVKQITIQLEAIFVEFDKKVADGTVEYLKSRFVALQAAKEEFNLFKHNVWVYYPKLYEAAGGKGNYQLIQYGVGKNVELAVRKSEKLKSDTRNIRIAKKLEEAGITFVSSIDVNYSTNGFNGVFEVETNKGSKKVIVETIFACGEVQCPHFRVLVKIK